LSQGGHEHWGELSKGGVVQGRIKVILTGGGGGAHSPAGQGLEESQFRRLEKKLSTLPTLWSHTSKSHLSSPAAFLF
jgi:hypothetical protein